MMSGECEMRNETERPNPVGLVLVVLGIALAAFLIWRKATETSEFFVVYQVSQRDHHEDRSDQFCGVLRKLKSNESDIHSALNELRAEDFPSSFTETERRNLAEAMKTDLQIWILRRPGPKDLQFYFARISKRSILLAHNLTDLFGRPLERASLRYRENWMQTVGRDLEKQIADQKTRVKELEALAKENREGPEDQALARDLQIAKYLLEHLELRFEPARDWQPYSLSLIQLGTTE